MYSEEDLNSAIAAGILSQEAAEAFRRHVTAQRNIPRVDEEAFRLVTGFNDIFVVIASALFLISVGWIGAASAGWIGAIGVAITSWALAEFFTRRRRMALPSIVLLLACVGSVFAAWLSYFGKGEGHIIAAGAVSSLVAYMHWRRFRVPITVAVGAAAAVGSVAGVLIAIIPSHKAWTSLLFLCAGSIVFFLAMHWDSRDVQRKSYRADVAFWLHLLAAPLIVHSLFRFLGIEASGQVTATDAVAVLILYLALAGVSLAIDRRALMVSALAYVLYTFSALLKAFGVVSMGFAITALAMGGFLLLLSVFWHPVRARVVHRLPMALQEHLPETRERVVV